MKLDKALPIYETDTKDKYRYSLGAESKKTLLVIGVNPSKATDVFLDPTLTNVNSFTELLGFKSFIMFNLYPQRSTDPNGMHKRISKLHYQQNIDVILKYMNRHKNIWASWGNLIEHRPYLIETLKTVYIEGDDKHRWIHYGELTKQGHPPHPSRKRLVKDFKTFNIKSYLEI